MSEDKGKELSKAEVKAARRLKQESQRAAKAALQNAKAGKPGATVAPAAASTASSPAQSTPSKPIVETSAASPALTKPAQARPTKPKAQPSEKNLHTQPQTLKTTEIQKETRKVVVVQHRVKLFNHLYFKDVSSGSLSVLSHGVHPAILCLGVQYAKRVIVGSNARCFAFLNAMKEVIADYKTPQQKEFGRGLESSLQPSMSYLAQCRPLSVSMTNALRHLKWQITQLPNNVTDDDAKHKLQESIDTYLRDQIETAAQAICLTVQSKISSGDVIVTYGCSSLIEQILLSAHDKKIDFRVVILDSRPWLEGRQMLRRLVHHGIKCSYVLVNAASFIMREATKVLLGAHALLTNGYVMSRVGSSQVALLAKSFNKPVLVCCETHKFSERVQTDSFVYNEIGDPDELATVSSCRCDTPMANWKNIPSLTPLNLCYDVCPPDLVTAVVTELAILPCTSVPVVLRVKPTDAHL